jgi:hypothetical protein
MKFQVKASDCEPFILIAETAEEALRIAVNGVRLAHLRVEADIEMDGNGGLFATVWKNGRWYQVKPWAGYNSRAYRQ